MQDLPIPLQLGRAQLCFSMLITNSLSPNHGFQTRGGRSWIFGRCIMKFDLPVNTVPAYDKPIRGLLSCTCKFAVSTELYDKVTFLKTAPLSLPHPNFCCPWLLVIWPLKTWNKMKPWATTFHLEKYFLTRTQTTDCQSTQVPTKHKGEEINIFELLFYSVLKKKKEKNWQHSNLIHSVNTVKPRIQHKVLRSRRHPNWKGSFSFTSHVCKLNHQNSTSQNSHTQSRNTGRDTTTTFCA